MVISYPDLTGKYKQIWFKTGLVANGNKTKAQATLAEKSLSFLNMQRNMEHR